MEMKKVGLMTLLMAMVFMATIVTSTADSVVDNRKMLDSNILLNVDSSLGECWGRFCAPWSPCQSGCACIGAVGTGACVGFSSANLVVDNSKMLDSNILLNVESSLGQCWGKFCAPWSPCQSGCTCVGAIGTGVCTTF